MTQYLSEFTCLMAVFAVMVVALGLRIAFSQARVGR